MALVARISAKSGKTIRSIKLHKGVNVLPADADAVVTVVDDATGLAVDHASVVRNGAEVRVAVADSYFAATQDAPAAGTGGAPEATPASDHASDAGESHGSNGLLYGILGAAALGGLAVGAGGGGGGGKKDTTAPAAPTGLALAAADDTGSSSTDRVTNLTSGLTITGTAEANSTVTIKDGSTTLGTATANASGAFTLDVSLAAGTHSLTATATDAAGNASPASTVLSITVDTAAPAAPAGLVLAAADDTGASSTDGITSQTSGLTITGTAEAGSTVTIKDGATTLGTVTATAGGTFSLDVSLAAGGHTITATATDTAGNVSGASTALALTVDTGAPAAPTGLILAAADDTGVSSTDGITSQTSGLTISGTAEAGSTVVIKDGATTLGTVTATAGGTFSLDVSLAAGTHSVTATATDAAGNASGASSALAITVDATAPAAPTGLALAAADDLGTSNSDGLTSLTSGLTITGTAEAGSTVVIKDGATTVGSGTADANGAFSIDVALAAGAHSLTATANDAAGNAGTASSALAITVDTTAPTVAITAQDSALLGAQTTTLTFTFSEVPDGFTLADVSVTGGAVSALTVSPTDAKVYTATLTPDAGATLPGTIAVSVAGGTFADAAGNAASAASSFSIAFDPGSSGQVIDGYLANALVFRDSDGDGVWDHESFTDANNNGLFDTGETFVDANADGAFTAEFHTVTDAAGNYSGLYGTGNIVVTPLIAGNGASLTTDIATGKTFTGVLTAPAGSSVVTPLTTLVAALAPANATQAQLDAAEAQVKAAFGIDAGVDLATFDPLATIATSTDPAEIANALAAQKAAIQVGNILSVMASAADAANVSGGAAAGASAAIDGIASQIAAGGTVDLSNPATVGAIVDSVATQTGSSAIAGQSEAVGDALASVNGAVQDAAGSDPLSTLGAATAAQIVAQDTLAAEVGTAVSGGAPLDSTEYEAGALTDKLDDAADEVGNVVAPEPAAPGAVAAPDRPVVDDGTRVSGAEAVDGVVVTVSFAAAGGAQAGDTLKLMLGDTEVKSVVLAAGDIPAAGASGIVSFTLSAAELGADGAKSLSAAFVTAGGIAGPASLPAVFTLDTATDTPTGLALDAADDTGVSSSDGVTSRTSGLTITGAAEANATVELKEGATTIGTGTADADGRFSIDVSLGGGVHSVTAIATDVAGNLSATSSALTVTVLTTGPAAPSALVATEGTLITGGEAADGTTITGTTTAGTTVALTLTNDSGATLVKQAVVAGTSFSVALSAAEIAQLGEGTVRYSAVATDAAGNTGAASATGSYLYTTQPIVSPEMRIDGSGALVVADDEENVIGVTPLAGGGFVVHWLVDVDGDQDAEGLALQRFAADGSKDGGITVLQGVSQDLLTHEGEGTAVDFAALSNGGYVLSYTLVQDTSAHPVVLSLQIPQAPIIGVPAYIGLNGAPAGATYALSGMANDGTPLSVALTPDSNGQIFVSQAVLDQFKIDNRLSFVVGGLASGEQVNAFIIAKDDVTYDSSIALRSAAASGTVQPSGFVAFSDPSGRVESFHIDTITGTPTSVVMLIAPSAFAAGFDLSGVPGASLRPDGQIQIVNPALGADGSYHVPGALLAQLGGEDFRAVLVLNGLTAGNTVTATLGVRDGTPVSEGVFVQTFGADGTATSATGVQVDTSSAPVIADSDGETGAKVTALPGGGFAVNWVVDADRDGEPDGIAFQRFAADGTKSGGVTQLSGVSDLLLSQVERVESYDIQALPNGGHVLAYALELDEVEFQATISQQSPNLQIVGRPSVIYLGNELPNVTYSLSGTGNDGNPKTVVLTPSDGQLTITQLILDQFGIDNRFTLVTTGLTQGQTIPAYIVKGLDVTYDTSISLEDVTVSRTVLAQGIGVLATGEGRPETFHIDSSSKPPTFVNMTITLADSNRVLDISGIPNAVLTPGGVQINNIAIGADGLYHVPQSILTQVGDADFQAFLIVGGQTAGSTITGTIGVREGTPVDSGVFVHTFDANGVLVPGSDARIDLPGTDMVTDSDVDALVHVTPLANGGYVVSWVADTNADGDADALVVQRFAADGTKVGLPTPLQGIPAEAFADDDIAFDLQALENGGYVLAVNAQADEAGWSIPFGGTSGSAIPIVGRPETINVAGAPAGAAFFLTGTGNDGLGLQIALTPDSNGTIQITQAILDQFAVDNRFTFSGTGLTSSFGLSVETRADAIYEADSPLVEVVRSVTTPANATNVGIAAGRLPDGTTGLRAEVFHLDTPNVTPTSAAFLVTLQQPGLIDVSGIANAQVLQNGQIRITGITADANGDYRVPQALLDQLDSHDALIVLTLGGVPSNTTLTFTIDARVPDLAIEGVHVITFDASGHALTDNLNLIGTAGHDVLVGGSGDDVLNGLAGPDVLTGGDGADLFVLEAPGGQTLSLADLVTDFQVGVDHLQLPSGISFADLTIAQGSAANGAAVSDTLVIHTGSGDILAHLANTEAQAMTQASFA